MCPQVNADFTGISSNFDPLEVGKMYHFELIEIQDQANDEEWKAKQNPQAPKSPAFVFVNEVAEGERAGALVQDYVYVTKKDGTPNKRGLGQIKAYAEAILGNEAANNPKGIDTDALVNGHFDGVMKGDSYKDEATNQMKTSVKLGKILARR